MKPPTFPARPVNGGPLDKALPKRGDWLYEPKFNGWRALIHVPTGAMFNRKLERLSIEQEFKKALAELRAELEKDLTRLLYPELHGRQCLTPAEIEWADTEALERRHNRGRGSLVLLDLPLLRLPILQRGYVCRETFCPALDHCACKDTVYSVPQYTDGATTYWDLQESNRDLGCEFYEGVVAKRADSLYPLQARSPEEETTVWMKHRWRF